MQSRRAHASRVLVLVVCVSLATLLLAAQSFAASTTNGGFETGDFTGWTVGNPCPTDPNGNWFVYSGTTSPFSTHVVPAPPAGTFAATTDQGGPGTQLLYQDVLLEPGMRHYVSALIASIRTTPTPCSAQTPWNVKRWPISSIGSTF